MTTENLLVIFVAISSLVNSIVIYNLAKHIERLYKRIG